MLFSTMMHKRHALDSRTKRSSLPTTDKSHTQTSRNSFSRKLDHIVRICKIWWLTSSIHLRAFVVLSVAISAIVLLVWGECFTPSSSSGRGSSQGDDLRHIKHFARQLERLVRTSTSLGKEYKLIITKPFKQVLKHDDIYSDPIAYKSLRWMVRSYTPDEDIEESTLLQRYALAILYFATGGDEFWLKCSFHRPSATPCNENNEEGNKRKVRFLTWTRNECDWYGVTCNEQGRVTRLSWTENGLAQPFSDEDKPSSFAPPELLLLESLELLWWSGNQNLVGTIPSWISQMTSLRSLSLHDTSVAGTLPLQLYAMTNLESIRLYNAEFNGSLASDIGKLSSLTWLWLHSNQFTGAIPSELGLMTDLVGLTLHGNELEKPPKEVCSLRQHHKLEELWTDCLEVSPTDTKPSCTCCTKCLPQSK